MRARIWYSAFRTSQAAPPAGARASAALFVDPPSSRIDIDWWIESIIVGLLGMRARLNKI
jgi:hypothetical protein